MALAAYAVRTRLKGFTCAGNMQANIVSMPAFTVVGMKLRTKVESAQMAKLWGNFMPRSSEIAAMPNVGPMYGVMDNYDEQTGQFDSMACFSA